MVRTFVDTNVLVYAHDVAAGRKRWQARDRLASLWRDSDGSVSAQVLQELYMNVTRKIPTPVRSVEARRLVRNYARWPLHRPDLEELLEATDVAERNQISFWDALIVVSARAMGAEVLLTEDLSHGQVIEGIRVEDPFMEDPHPSDPAVSG
ncbi:MAG: PIN domain-containing protein [Chloroflexi bacterium]|nr:PIN domain-containing protein [Chloroflexota bacterium]